MLRAVIVDGKLDDDKIRLFGKQIILATTILCHDKSWDRSIDEVCTRIGSERVHHFLYTKNGSGTPGHIRIPEAEQMSDELAAYINSLGDAVWES